MANDLGSLKPAAIWKHFEKICAIPHPSSHEQKIAAYVKDFATSCGCEATMDAVGNVIVRKPATKGMENRRGVVLQAHLDMVPQKNQNVKHDFLTDPIKPVVDGNSVKATGTTLGSDNGIGIAAVLAILESKDVPHGPLEALFTLDEEQGMTGANALKAGVLKGDVLFNLDSEDEGEVCISCAGGMDVKTRIPCKEEATPGAAAAFKVTVGGLRGGHSGCDIQLNRGNATKVLNRILWEAHREMDLHVGSIEGGTLRNAIPRDAWAVVTVPKDKADAFLKKVETVAAAIGDELKSADPDLKVRAEKADLPAKVMDASATTRLLDALYACPHGAFALVDGMPNVAETSTNLAVVKSENGVVSVTCMLRSSFDSKRPDVANMIRSVFELAGGESDTSNEYPGWAPNFDSPVLTMLKDVYKNKFGKEPKVTATHGGLECGIIRSKYPTMDAVSFGPTIKFPHSPDEHVLIDTVQKFWDFLTGALKQVPTH